MTDDNILSQDEIDALLQGDLGLDDLDEEDDQGAGASGGGGSDGGSSGFTAEQIRVLHEIVDAGRGHSAHREQIGAFPGAVWTPSRLPSPAPLLSPRFFLPPLLHSLPSFLPPSPGTIYRSSERNSVFFAFLF